MSIEIEQYIKETSLSKGGQIAKMGEVDIVVSSPLPDEINLSRVIHTFHKSLPSAYFRGLDAIYVMESPIFKKREINAFYRDAALFISPEQENEQDLVDDLVHEMAHHLETTHPEEIYGDTALTQEFRTKRKQVQFELASEGYNTQGLDFSEVAYDKEFDVYMYKRVGYPKLRNLSSGIFLRPYAITSVREYFASGFEAYYLKGGKKEDLYRVSPVLYNVIEKLHNDAL